MWISPIRCVACSRPFCVSGQTHRFRRCLLAAVGAFKYLKTNSRNCNKEEHYFTLHYITLHYITLLTLHYITWRIDKQRKAQSDILPCFVQFPLKYTMFQPESASYPVWGLKIILFNTVTMSQIIHVTMKYDIGPWKLNNHGDRKVIKCALGHHLHWSSFVSSFYVPKEWVTTMQGESPLVMADIRLILALWWQSIEHVSALMLTLKVLNFWKFTSYCSLKSLWSGMGEVVPARTSPTLHPPSPPTVHQLSQLALWEITLGECPP